ncbi:MAG: phosphatase PAP2 family protein [Promethearchaeota archaeon]|nr:MAG: phosphatase PAP2 family protein [Candidatus Lokiarchaeota archaeon]
MDLKEKVKNDILIQALILIIIAWAVLALIVGFTDLQISKAVVDPDSGWGNFGADYGEAPGYGLIAIGIAILIAYGMSKKGKDLKQQKLPAVIIGIIGIIVMIVGIIIDSHSTTTVGGGIGIALLGFSALTWNKDWAQYHTIASVIVLLAIIHPLLFVQVVKLTWGRVRPRDVLAGEGSFTPWYVINGYTGNQSFPSGHTAMGWMLLPLLITVRDREWKDPVKIITWICIIGWGLFVGLSRIVVGAHYASDVLFSTGMASVVTILLYKKFYNKE